MRITDLVGEAAGVGKIVKGINTTHDVRPGEIKRQSGKFGHRHTVPSAKLEEVFAPDAPLPRDVKWTQDRGDHFAEFEIDGEQVRIRILEMEPSNPFTRIKVQPGPGYDVEFSVDQLQRVTGTWGTQSARVMGKVVSVLWDWFSSHPWSWISFSGAGVPGQEGRSRVGLYRRMSQVLARRAGAEVYEKPHTRYRQGTSTFVIYKPADDKEVDEARLMQAPARGARWQSVGRRPYEIWETSWGFRDLSGKDHLIELEVNSVVNFNHWQSELTALPGSQGWTLAFSVDGEIGATGDVGASSARLFAEVLQRARGFFQDHKWDYIIFSGAKGSRNRMYSALGHMLAQESGAEFFQVRNEFVISKGGAIKKKTPSGDLDEAGGVGLVVPGVNMPAGQHSDEIRRQAKKFGNKVSSKGVPPTIKTNGMFESVSGDRIWNTIHQTHHEPINNPNMERFVKSHRWGIEMIQPQDLTPEEELFDRDDPFNRIVDIDPSRVRWYVKHWQTGRALDPIVMGPEGSVIDGNHRAQAAIQLNKPIQAYVPMEALTEDQALPPEVEEFLQSLSSDDVGVEQVGSWTVHFEGFSEWCQSDAQDRCNLPSSDPRHLPSYESVYDEVLNDFIEREGGRQPVKSGLVGDQDYPVFYAVFDSRQLT